MVIKRCFDIVASLFGLILFSPVMLIAAFMIRLSMGSPVFFRQQRPGYKGIPFQLVKFRTMKPVCLDGFNDQSDEVRLTKMGRFLRRTSLDELPEFWNVLKGEMSIVGPRPLLMDYLSRYSSEQARRHDVKPGITGWAQVNGRNAITWEERFKLDVWYVDNRSFFLDMKILWMTLAKVFLQEGISADQCATMTEFKGSEQKRR
ncbi:MAG TPA: sugar transferase [Syntrophorhabdaceae bacterium]|jgi:lipopolysaccharide/colanic/teichoic acid biosynthesis glycosyltransferase|nr:sugar transferase [Syntrophorhabdaceae bacterium]MDI9559590.1 sugar transferase [Pseudomonadota bacterium]MBP8698470.1 sugar transferase [Syntrophorhabdaceae bacterium]MBV6506450.1 putative sugar transferase EpsL [Syntrophorhabdaceae bacterium]HNZ58145.1 sugar transferase [Syntrophorhabdaceae bacterium]